MIAGLILLRGGGEHQHGAFTSLFMPARRVEVDQINVAPVHGAISEPALGASSHSWASAGIGASASHLPLSAGHFQVEQIEHRMFCFITQNWRVMPLVSLYVAIALIAHTTTKKAFRSAVTSILTFTPKA